LVIYLRPGNAFTISRKERLNEVLIHAHTRLKNAMKKKKKNREEKDIMLFVRGWAFMPSSHVAL